MSGSNEGGDTVGEGGNERADEEERYAEQEVAWTDSSPPVEPARALATAMNAPKSQKRDWIDYLTVVALFATFLAALGAAFEADRLAHDTEKALSDARLAALTAHNDNIDALNNTANAIGQAQAAANLAHTDNIAALQAAKDANKGTSKAAKVQERLTVQSNAINKQAFTAAQRAFMFTNGIDFKKGEAPGRIGLETGGRPIAWRADVQWENGGNTPTKDLSINTRCLESVRGPVDAPYEVTKTDMGKGLYLSGSIVNRVFGPKQADIAGICPFDPISLILNAFSPTGISYYVFGEATYKDVLGESASHVTKFCYIVQITGNPETGYHDIPGIEPLHSTYVQCQKHNCADEECKREKSN
ncbi:MAG: hypothetical protein ABSA49_16635 [Rhizomicrobium sp.]|jgi:hypothetical protein